MLKKNLLIVSVITVMLFAVQLINAQEKPSEMKDKQTMMQHDDMQKCMDNIAADSTMRMQMMDKMMSHAKGDKEGMMQMCKMMMDNPEMHKMMKKMMGGEMMKDGMMKNNMKSDSTKTMDKSENESHHQKK